MNKYLLLVEDDEVMRQFLTDFLQEEGFIVTACELGTKAVDHIQESLPDIVVLDLQLPDISGESVLDEIRKLSSSVPVILLTAKSTISDLTQGLNLGADDYISKPFDAQELLARIHARLRPTGGSTDVFKIQDLSVDTRSYQVTKANKSVQLTKTEFKLLHNLLRNAGIVMTREMLLHQIWGFDTDVETRVVDIHISNLRKKIESADSPIIQSKRGFGYYIESNTE